MSKKLVFLHTVPTLVGLFKELVAEILPAEIELLHLVDEILLKVVLAQGGLSPFIYRRVSEHARAAEEAGADALLLTCSSISPCADVARLLVRIPVLKIDELMVRQAITLGRRIGVVATAPTTLKPTSEAVQTQARLAGAEVQVDPVLRRDAYEALFAGDLAMHDRIVRETIKELMSRNDVVILAQASMARVADTIPADERLVPVLSSPRLAVENARDVLETAQYR